MNYLVYVKSHSEAPDFEAEYSEEELKAGVCLIPYVDEVEEDEDGMFSMIASKCGGKLITTIGGYKCTSCEQAYYKDEDEDEELQQYLHDDYLEAEATNN